MTSEPLTPEDRWAAGRAARALVPRSAHAEHVAPPDRADPVALLEEQGHTRVQELLPIRYGRMLVSPFTFYRGAARIMAADLAAGKDTGLRVQLCGDAHLSNFGLFGSAERSLVFDLNDFDETSPGPFGWDVKRLATSVEIAGRDNGFTEAERATAVSRTVGEYCSAMTTFAGMKNLDVWYAKLDIEKAMEGLRQNMAPATEKRVEKTIAAARAKDSMRAFDRLTEVVDGKRHIISDPPLVVPVAELMGRERSEDLRAELDVADDEGGMAVVITTIGQDFGCLVRVPEAGIYLNSGMANYDPRPGRPNSLAPGRMPLFGVPTYVVHGEIFWGGDRLDMVIEKLDAMGLRRKA